MAKLSGSVGEGGQNAPHDVSLIRLMLSIINSSTNEKYLTEHYDRGYGPAVRAAVASFQSDNAMGAAPVPGALPEKRGVIVPGGETFAKLLGALPEPWKGVRTTAGISVAYMEMSQSVLRDSLTAIQHPTKRLLDITGKLLNLVNDFYNQTGIVLSLNSPDGWWRSFDQQVPLTSQGGPGESIHHYGRAVDLGFSGLRWINPIGNQITAANLGAKEPTPPPKVRNEFWAVRRAVAQRQPGLYPTTAFGGGDLSHLQDLEDRPLDSVSSFVALMERFGPRRMKWELFEMTPTSYKCDLGLGGEKYILGRAVDIWVLDPSDRRWLKAGEKKPFEKAKRRPRFKLTKVDLAKALNAKIKADPKYSFDSFLGTPNGTHAAGTLTINDISEKDLIAVHVIVREEFAAAANRWKEWKPVLYPDEGRRPTHKDNDDE